MGIPVTMSKKNNLLEPKHILLLQEHPENAQTIIDDYQLSAIIDESPKGTYKVVKGFGERKLLNDYKAVIRDGDAILRIRNCQINKQIGLDISLHSCTVLSYKFPGSGEKYNQT
jgi:hypothetical protein